MTSPPADPSASNPTPQGFGHSNKRIALEIGLFVGGLLLLAGGAIWAAGAASAWLLPVISPKVDVSIGKSAWQSPEFALNRCSNPGPLEYVQQVSRPLIDKLGDSPFQFEFQVVDNKDVNAFALPGGFITVNMGLLEQATSGEEVAAVIAHELQHVLLRHGTRRMLRRMGGFVVMSLIFGGTGVEYPAYLVSELTQLSYDRDEESESDLQGLTLMQQAGIDPLGMKTFFERMAAKSDLTPPAVLSTHPDPGDRASRAQQASSSGGPWSKLPPPKDLVCKAAEEQ